jgi:hypothetical protein
MKRSAIRFFFFLVIITVPSSFFGQNTFRKTLTELNSFGDAWGNYFLQTSDGGYLISCSDLPTSSTSRCMLVRADSMGDTVWTRRYSFGSYSAFANICRAEGNNFMVSGTIYPGYLPQGFFLMKIDPNGDSLWTRSYSYFPIYSCTVISTNDGGFLLYGTIYITTTPSVPMTAAFLARTNSSGDTLWTRVISDPDPLTDEGAKSVVETDDGGFVLTGFSSSTMMGIPEFLFIAKTSAGGTLLWTRNISPPSPGVYPEDISPAENGGVLILSDIQQGPMNNRWTQWVVRMNSAGDTIRTRVLPLSFSNTTSASMKRIGPDDYIFCGSAYPDSNSYDYKGYLVKIDSSANVIWERVYGDPEVNLNAVLVASDGGFASTGRYYNVPGWPGIPLAVYLLKTDEEGLITGIGEPGPDPSPVQLFPNPCRDEVTVKIPPGAVSCEIISMEGKSMEKIDLSAGGKSSFQVDSGKFPTGIYIIRITTKEKIFRKKLIKQ